MRSLAPGRWLVVEPERQGTNLAEMLSSTLPTTQTALVDLGCSRTVLRIAGARARDLLAKGCALDLQTRAFAAGA